MRLAMTRGLASRICLAAALLSMNAFGEAVLPSRGIARSTLLLDLVERVSSREQNLFSCPPVPKFVSQQARQLTGVNGIDLESGV